jgi:hypothetical protein
MDDSSHNLPALRATPNKLPITAHEDAPILPLLKALCPDPDLTLLVGGELGPVHKFKVSRSALCLASTVFCAMLRGKFSEAKKVEIELEEDDPDALLIVLRIAHWKLSEVRRSLSKAQLVNVATICDKYDMVTICRPFVPGWVQGWLGSRSCGDFEESLWVAWVFGYENDFDRIANSLLLNITTDSIGDIMHANVRLCEKTMPPDIVGKFEHHPMLVYISTLFRA